MNFENLEVTHKAFGDGVIVKKEGKYITTRFGAMEKIFVYPDIFEKFLSPKDESLIDIINSDLQIVKSEKQKIIDKKNAENLHAMTHGIVIPGKEINLNETDDEDNKFKNSDTDEV